MAWDTIPNRADFTCGSPEHPRNAGMSVLDQDSGDPSNQIDLISGRYQKVF
jgi:hypothetical protein